MTQPRRRWAHGLVAVGFASLALLLSGCVYLRLLQLKRQLGQFDRFFALQTDDGVRLICQTPMLLADDVRWLGLLPESVKKLGQAEQWRVRWVKQLPAGMTESGTASYDIEIELGFADGKLTRLAIPERFFAIMPKSLLVGVFRSLGRGSIDQGQRKFETRISTEETRAARPRLPAIGRLLGRPGDQRAVGTTTVMRYRYVPVTSEPRANVFDMTLYFDTASGELLRWQGRTPVGNIGFNFAAKAKSDAPLPTGK